MLSKLREDIAECYQHAEECALRAKGEPDARLRQDFIDMERRWLFLACSYEFTERLTLFTNELGSRSKRREPS